MAFAIPFAMPFAICSHGTCHTALLAYGIAFAGLDVSPLVVASTIFLQREERIYQTNDRR
jgi:hypothetical protein